MSSGKKIVLAAVAIGLLVSAGWLGSIRWRVQRAVEKYKNELRARGEKLTVAELIPAKPAGANGARALMDAANQVPSPDYLAYVVGLRMINTNRARVEWRQAVLPSSDASNVWEQAIPWMEGNRENLAAIRAALEAPSFQFDLNYAAGFNLPLPHLAPLKSLAQRLAHATLTEMRLGNFDLADANHQALLALNQRHQVEPLMISHFVRIAMTGIAVGVTWEASQHPGWTDRQLALWQSQWEQLDLLGGIPACLEMERAMLVEAFPQLRKSPNMLFDPFGGAAGVTNLWSDFVDDPRASTRQLARVTLWRLWICFKDEQLCLERMQTYLGLARRMNAGSYVAIAADEKKDEDPPSLYLAAGMLTSPGLKYLSRVAAIETQRRIVYTAIALKRHRLRHHRYPETLAVMVPEFLPSVPLDFMDGQPLRYRRTGNDAFVLYSVGPDFHDDGGDASPVYPAGRNSSPPTAFSWTRAKDWVWPWPASQEEVEAYTEMVRKRRF